MFRLCHSLKLSGFLTQGAHAWLFLPCCIWDTFHYHPSFLSSRFLRLGFKFHLFKLSTMYTSSCSCLAWLCAHISSTLAIWAENPCQRVMVIAYILPAEVNIGHGLDFHSPFHVTSESCGDLQRFCPHFRGTYSYIHCSCPTIFGRYLSHHFLHLNQSRFKSYWF